MTEHNLVSVITTPEMIEILYMHSMRYIGKMTFTLGQNFKRASLKVVLILNKFILNFMTYQSVETSSALPKDLHSQRRAFGKDFFGMHDNPIS